jgi:Zn-dependent protease
MNPVQLYNDMTTNTGAYYVFVVVAVLFHEFGHVVACRALGIKVLKVGISWRGPFVRRERSTPANNLLVHLYGPVMNLFLCLMTLGIMKQFALVNMMVACVNLLPFRGSDGYQSIRAVKEILN